MPPDMEVAPAQGTLMHWPPDRC